MERGNPVRRRPLFVLLALATRQSFTRSRQDTVWWIRGFAPRSCERFAFFKEAEADQTHRSHSIKRNDQGWVRQRTAHQPAHSLLETYARN